MVLKFLVCPEMLWAWCSCTYLTCYKLMLICSYMYIVCIEFRDRLTFGLTTFEMFPPLCYKLRINSLLRWYAVSLVSSYYLPTVMFFQLTTDKAGQIGSCNGTRILYIMYKGRLYSVGHISSHCDFRHKINNYYNWWFRGFVRDILKLRRYQTIGRSRGFLPLVLAC